MEPVCGLDERHEAGLSTGLSPQTGPMCHTHAGPSTMHHMQHARVVACTVCGIKVQSETHRPNNKSLWAISLTLLVYRKQYCKNILFKF